MLYTCTIMLDYIYLFDHDKVTQVICMMGTVIPRQIKHCSPDTCFPHHTHPIYSTRLDHVYEDIC